MYIELPLQSFLLQIPPTPLSRNLVLVALLVLPVLGTLLGCRGDSRPDKTAKVYIDNQNGRYSIIRNGKPFKVKGAGGYSHFRELHEAGGNTLRIWDTTHLAQTLDSASKYDLAVIVGLPIPNSGDIALYQSEKANASRYQALQALVRRYKKHPAVLMWCLGNELDFPYKWVYTDFYSSFNALTDMIHEEDPDHPITTTVLNFNPKYIFNIRLRCDVDLISFNIFSTIPLLRRDLAGLECTPGCLAESPRPAPGAHHQTCRLPDAPRHPPDR